jgi:Tol biopolymer transport system component
LRARLAFIAVLGVALSATVAPFLQMSAPARAAFPGKNGLIAFGKGVSGVSQVFVAHPDGTHLRQVTHEPAGAFDPAFSANGKRIAFVAVTGATKNTTSIFTIRVDGTHRRRVTFGTGFKKDSLPAFSPNGKWIAFVRLFREKAQQVFLVGADGTHLHQLTHLPQGSDEPAFRPDGKTIAFDGGRNRFRGRNIFTIRPNGTHLRRLTHIHQPHWGVGYPDYSPDGQHILCMKSRFVSGQFQDRILSVMRSDGRHLHHLRHLRARNAENPVFSPNGKRITFDRLSNPPPAIFTAFANGSKLRRLTNGLAPSWGPAARR